MKGMKLREIVKCPVTQPVTMFLKTSLYCIFLFGTQRSFLRNTTGLTFINWLSSGKLGVHSYRWLISSIV